MDLGKWLKNRKDQAVRQWQDSVILDAVSSNTKADQARRATQGTPLTVRQQASNTYGGGFSAPVNRVKDIFSADTEADFIKRKAVTGLFEDYNTQQNRQNEIAKNDPTQRSGIRQFGNNLYGGVMEFGGKAPGAILDAKASYDRSTIGKVNYYVNPLTRGQALLGLAQDKLRGDALGTNYDQRTKAMQDFGVAQQDLVQNKVDQSRFGQRTADNKWLAGSGRALGNVGGQVALTVASGGSTLPGALVSGAQTFSQQRQEAMDAGKSESYATNVGALQGGVQAVTEKIGLDKLKFPGGSNFVINTLKRFGTEGAQEGGQQFAQNLITNKTYNPNQGLKEGVLESAILGGFAGGTAGAVFDIPGAIPQTGIPAQPGGIRERIQIAKENVNSVINGSPDALSANQVVRNPAVFDAVMDKMKQLENPDAYTTAELNEMNQVLFDASKETGIPFLQGSREQQRQTLAQFQEMNGEALQNPQTTLRDRIRSAKDRIIPKGEDGFVQLPGKQSDFQTTTGDKAIDAKIKQIVEMSPDEYLRQAFEATDGRLGGNYESWLASNAQDALVAKQYAEAMLKGDKFPLAYIDKAMGSQDGRNRAIAAKLAGKEKMPVGIIPEMTPAEKINWLKGKVSEYPEKSYLGNKYRRELNDLYNQSKPSLKDKLKIKPLNDGGYVKNPFYKEPKTQTLRDYYDRSVGMKKGDKQFTITEAKTLLRDLTQQKAGVPKEITQGGYKDLTPQQIQYALNNPATSQGKAIRTFLDQKIDRSNELYKYLDNLQEKLDGLEENPGPNYKKDVDKLIDQIKDIQDINKDPYVIEFKKYVQDNKELLDSGDQRAINEAADLRDNAANSRFNIDDEDILDLPESKFLDDAGESIRTYDLNNLEKDTQTIAPNQSDLLSYKPQKQPIGEVAQQPKTVAPVESKTPYRATLLDVSAAKNNIQEIAKGGRWEGWYGNGDTGYLPKIEQDILNNKNVRDSGASLFYDNYKKANNIDIGFDEFMNTDITLYRGGKARKDNIVSYSFDKNMAARHGEVSSITVKPKDTYGMYTTTAEQEVLVPAKSVTVQQAPTTKKFTPISQPVDSTPAIVKQVTKMQSSNKQVSKDRYSIANSDIARTKSTGMNQDGFTVEDWGGKKRYVSLDDASPETKMKVRKAEAEYEAAKKANNGTALAAKQKVNDAYSDAINDLNLQDYATTDSGTRTFNSRYNDWLETKYKDRNVDTATIKDMAANPQKYRQQFEAETSQPIGEVAQQPKTVAPVESKTKEGAILSTIKEKPNKLKRTWYRGVNDYNQAKDIYSSSDKGVAEDYGAVRKLTQAELPKNPLLIDGGKENFMTEIGYNEAKWGHPTAESVGQPSSETYDTLIKKYALKNGYDGVVYDYGSGEVPELVVYNKPETKKPFTPISQPVDNTPAIVKQVTKAKTPKATPVDAKSYAKVFDTTEAEAKAQLNKPATVSVRGNDTNKLLEKMKTDKKINDAVAEAQASGKELNFFAKKDANDRSVGIEQFNPKYHRIEAGFVVDEDGNMLGNHIKVDETGIQVNVGGKVINTEAVIGNPLDWGSKGKIDKTFKGRYKFSETMNRNIDNNAPTPEIANQTKTFLWSNKVKAEANMRTELEQEFTNLNDRIKKTNKARPRGVSKEQYKEDIFATLNGDKTDAEIRKEYDAKPAEAILTYKKETRKLYDSLLTRINAERVKFGQEAITPRKDYITHLQEMNQQKGFVSEVYGTMKNSFADEGMGKTRSGVPGDIAGRTEGFKPISRYNPFLQRRTGTDSLKDPYMAVQEYLQPALYNIHMTEPAARARAIEAAFRTAEQIRNLDSKAVATEMETTLEKYKNKSSDNSKLITGFQEYANALAGKTQRLDRQVIDTSDGTAKALKGWQGLQRIGGRGTILGNLSSVLAQPLNQVVGFADAGGINYAKGIAEYMGGNSEIDKSDFIRARETEAAKPLRGTGEKINDAGAIPLQAAELASVKLLWHTQHQKALGAGYKGQEAIQQADMNTERLVAGRGIADKPEAYRSTVTNGLLQYTLEVNAQNKAFWQDLNTSQKVKFMVAATATNTLMAAITGYEPLPDFLKAIFETGKDFLDEEDDRNSLQKGFGGIQRMTSEYVGMNPLVGSAVNVLPQDARKKLFGSESEVGRYPGGNAPIQVVTNTIDAANKITKGDYKGAAESAIRNVPFGNQIRKTAGGIELINKGYATDSNGDPTYQAPTSTLGKAQVLAFGPNASKNAQNYYNEKEAGLTKDDLERLRDTPPEKREEYKQQLIAKNKASDKAKTDKEKRLKDSGSTTSKVNAINTASQDKLDALKASLSPDDYDISNMTKAEKKQVVESGIKTQSEMDGLDNYVKNKKKELGIATSEAKDLPNNINQKARQILEDENVSDAEWLKKPNTDTELSSTVASWLPKGITAPPVNNATAKSWAELEKKRAEGTLGKLEEESTKKTILRNAYNSVLTEDEKDLYSLSEDNLIDAYDRGVINDENINKALAVEKQLFDAGLINKETLANKLGLVARGYKGRSGGRGGRGSTAKDTSRTEINNLSLDTFSKLNQLLAGTTAKKSAPKRVVAQKAVTKKITVKA